MKKTAVLGGIAIALLLSGLYAFNVSIGGKSTKVDSKTLKWYSIEEAVALNKQAPKKILMDIYTDWCHWCKVMDKETFTDPAVIEYMNANFYAVKFDGEYKENITFKGKEYKFVNAGRRGINSLAYFFLDGRAAYPSLVYLDENFEKLKVSPGYKEPQQLIAELKGIVGE